MDIIKKKFHIIKLFSSHDKWRLSNIRVDTFHTCDRIIISGYRVMFYGPVGVEDKTYGGWNIGAAHIGEIVINKGKLYCHGSHLFPQ